MEQIQIRRKISLAPKCMDSKIVDHIYTKIDSMLSGHCTQKNGYVISIEPDVKILDNEIIANGFVLCDVEFVVNTLRPTEGQILEGKVFMIFDGGIFVEIYEKMKVLIPVNRITKYKYDEASETFKYKKRLIKQGDIISIKLDQIQFDHRGFNCIGILIT